MTGEKVVVTGATGYIAGIQIQDLLSKGYNVSAIVRNKSNTEKLQHLLQLDGASDRLTLEEGDLDTADYSTIFKDATYIIHTASPYIYTADDPERDIVQPAIKGNISVLEAAALIPSIKKIVITSSTAAIFDASKKKDVYTEDDWSDGTSIAAPYAYSKYLAEKRAHDWIKKRRETNPNLFEVVFINPAFVLGAPLAKHINTSIKTFAEALTGSPQNRRIGVTDVHDVVDIITYVMETSENFNLHRKLVANEVMTFKELGQRAASLFPHLEFNTNSTPDSSATNTLADPHHYIFKSISPIKLQREPANLNNTLKSTVEYLIANKHINPTNK
ncbi:NAD-dependent epimerase/dehydratase family protein [Heterostelium album PN500]|uniref:NAD-dependent epimerase/dehydratase family protein n=1 Tax=Heterostelium pallidum (strain ATCC 26659 / Pp 5 / PN500) TaxID=670386 RepID=D3BA68_HETP5|nr:NAD-dependent epimerase/dehydratase family protein [Heterostelium album PN500]EFA81455.1 NAD-dependent epimerase/dehydratase family protein [Heterostelium album PN500]|eukprot:XP_020433573.1 NAD-dependent epimerase/dehydratase family protein [Heterostelium album PN500]